MKLFTEVPIEKINEYSKLEGSAINPIKIILADEATKLLHGENSLKQIHLTIESLFTSSGTDDIESLVKIQLTNDDFKIDNNNILSIPIYELLVKSNISTSKSEAKRFIKQGGAKINDEKVINELDVITLDNFDIQGKLKLTSGKKKHVIILAPMIL